MYLKYIYRLLLTLCIGACSFSSYAASGDLFEYPTPPDSMVQLQDRCDYIVTRFWQRCNFERAMLKPELFNKTFGEWVDLMPLASADSVNHAITELIKKFEKKGPETLCLAQMAENWLWADTAELQSEEIMLPFVEAVVNHKKINKKDKAHFNDIAKVLWSSSIGSDVPAISYVKPDGSKGSLGDIKGSSVLLFFDDGSNVNCSISRIRLETDPNTKDLIERGELSIVYLYPGEPDDKWKEDAAKLPENWIVGYMPDAKAYFDLRAFPAFYFLNAAHKVLAKNLDADYLIGAFRTANSARKAEKSTKTE